MLRKLLLPTLALLSLTACTRRYVDFTITNNGSAALHAFELDYPGGSTGTTDIAAGKSFHYHFKSLHDGEISISYDDPAHKSHASTGPKWRENESGTLAVTVAPDYSPDWNIERGH